MAPQKRKLDELSGTGEQPTRQVIPVIGDSAVYVGRGLLHKIPEELLAHKGVKASRFVIISDETVWSLYGRTLLDAFNATGKFKKVSFVDGFMRKGDADPGCCGGGEEIEDISDGLKLVFTYQVPTGEDSKCRDVKAKIEDFMIEKRCNRDTCVIALGGGVVGDLVGFVAATYMRGVPFVQIPTSSTAMIDSSVGGKTAINVPGGKNLIGAFHQPVLVYMDMDCLKTLGRRELVEGIAEAIKMGCIRQLRLFETLEANPQKVMNLDPDLIQEVIYHAVEQKAEVVRLDEKEGGIRSTLNWGHTIGHAIEALKSPAMMHGECVSVGCVVEAELARLLGHASLTPEKIRRITDCFASYGLPVYVPRGLEIPALMKKMSLDKKNRGNSIRCTITTDIGASINDPQPVDKELMVRVMSESMAAGVKAGPEWTPHEGRHAVKAAGGQMAA